MKYRAPLSEPSTAGPIYVSNAGQLGDVGETVVCAGAACHGYGVSVPAYATPGFAGTPNMPVRYGVLPASPPADPPTDAPQLRRPFGWSFDRYTVAGHMFLAADRCILAALIHSGCFQSSIPATSQEHCNAL